MKTDKCTHCEAYFSIADLVPRPEIPLGYRRICKPCYRKNNAMKAAIHRKTLTEDQRNKRKMTWDASNKSRALRRKTERRKLHEEDFNKPMRACTKCNSERPREKFSFFWSKSLQSHRYRTSCDECLAVQRRNKERTDRGRYTNYKGDAKRRGRGIDFELTFEEFADIVHKPCDYCGDAPALGVDRVDSSRGYVIDNCVPCCRTCNVMKMDLPIEKWRSQMKKILTHLGEI